MKTKYCLPIAIASLALAANSANAGESSSDDARVHKLTVSLKAYFQGEYEEDEKSNGNVNWSQKIETEKLSNKEFLELMVDEDVIESVKGWSVVVVTDDTGDVVGPFLTKKDEDAIDISEFLFLGFGDDLIAQKGSYNDAKELEKNAYTYMGNGGIELSTSLVEGGVSGLVEIKGNTEEDADGFTDIISTVKFMDLTGSADEGDTLLSGSASAAKGAKGDLSDFLLLP